MGRGRSQAVQWGAWTGGKSSGGKSALLAAQKNPDTGPHRLASEIARELNLGASDDEVRARVVDLLVGRDGLTRKAAERRLDEAGWTPEGLRRLHRAYRHLGKIVPRHLLQQADLPMDEILARAAPERATGDLAERHSWLDPFVPVRRRQLGVSSGELSVQEWRRQMRYPARFPESVVGYESVKSGAIGVLSGAPSAERAADLFVACAADPGRSDPHLLVTTSGYVHWCFAVARRLPSGELRAFGAVGSLDFRLDGRESGNKLAMLNTIIEGRGLPRAVSLREWRQTPCVSVDGAFLADKAVEGDLVSILGPERCSHENAGWLTHQPSLTKVLQCPDCERTAIACVPLHRTPERSDLSQSAQAGGYLEREGFYDHLAGLVPCESWPELLARDGLMSLDPIAYAIGPTRAGGASTLTVSQAMKRR